MKGVATERKGPRKITCQEKEYERNKGRWGRGREEEERGKEIREREREGVKHRNGELAVV